MLQRRSTWSPAPRGGRARPQGEVVAEVALDPPGVEEDPGTLDGREDGHAVGTVVLDLGHGLGERRLGPLEAGPLDSRPSSLGAGSLAERPRPVSTGRSSARPGPQARSRSSASTAVAIPPRRATAWDALGDHDPQRVREHAVDRRPAIHGSTQDAQPRPAPAPGGCARSGARRTPWLPGSCAASSTTRRRTASDGTSSGATSSAAAAIASTPATARWTAATPRSRTTARIRRALRTCRYGAASRAVGARRGASAGRRRSPPSPARAQLGCARERSSASPTFQTSPAPRVRTRPRHDPVLQPLRTSSRRGSDK